MANGHSASLLSSTWNNAREPETTPSESSIQADHNRLNTVRQQNLMTIGNMEVNRHRKKRAVSNNASVDAKNDNGEVILEEGPGSTGPAIVSFIIVANTGKATVSSSITLVVSAFATEIVPTETIVIEIPVTSGTKKDSSKQSRKGQSVRRKYEIEHISYTTESLPLGGKYLSRQRSKEKGSSDSKAAEKKSPSKGDKNDKATTIRDEDEDTWKSSLSNADWIWTNEVKNGVAPIGARAFRRVSREG
ncbi:hypothetical protein CPB84DRAFT_1752068 [Gymnopilus junonius]|uniref:Uncharacterized protein n=1 Tax=Gymnopilus junonius TaxID=109634 RepID=A0A9P5TI34_GYMJU|nr:hypothetical protein CPB84DRAFT_1752068 [Gymnopilus junonius]